MTTPGTSPEIAVEPQPPSSSGRSGSVVSRVLWTILLLGGLASGAAVFMLGGAPRSLLAFWEHSGVGSAEEPPRPGHSTAAARVPPARPGLVQLGEEDAKTIGVKVVAVGPQTRPMLLDLSGRTAYDPTTITKIRPRFDTRVESVFAELGQPIKKGDPLVELYSTDLASAKTDFQTKYVQWQHDLKLHNLRQRLVETGAISQQLWVDTQNELQKSRLFFNISQDKLAVFYEVPKEEIDPLLLGLDEKSIDIQSFGTVSDKAKMTMRAKTDGIVISREVVPGNYYETTDVLMEVAPLDHLWVWVNVFELDQEKVAVGQVLRLEFPFLSEKIVGKVDFVATEVSRDTRAVQVRATIPNPGSRLKSDMLVKARLEIPPVKGHTVVPRVAMVTISGNEYVFVRRPAASSEGHVENHWVAFERRQVRIAQENSDEVIVASGLSAGEEVATTGSLILSQLHEDQEVVASGLPAR